MSLEKMERELKPSTSKRARSKSKSVSPIPAMVAPKLPKYKSRQMVLFDMLWAIYSTKHTFDIYSKYFAAASIALVANGCQLMIDNETVDIMDVKTLDWMNNKNYTYNADFGFEGTLFKLECTEPSTHHRDFALYKYTHNHKYKIGSKSGFNIKDVQTEEFVTKFMADCLDKIEADPIDTDEDDNLEITNSESRRL